MRGQAQPLLHGSDLRRRRALGAAMKNRRILLQTFRPEAWEDFVEQLQHDGCTVCMTATIDQCKEAARRDIPVLALLDPPSGDHARAWVLELMMIDAGMHTAVVTEMDEEVFHDVMEGLGILTPLPPAPGASEARKMLGLLEQVESLGG